MSNEEGRSGAILQSYFAATIASAVIGAVIFFTIKLVSRPARIEATVNQQKHVAEDSLIGPREALTREADYAAASSALQQINSYLADHPDQRPAALSNEEMVQLRTRFGLNDEEDQELGQGNFTTLDGHYLDSCLLLRDAARALDIEETGPDRKSLRQNALQRAESAFHWAMRQVRRFEHGDEPLPVAYVLRRGWGSSWERALTFLALLDQVAAPEPLHGCLLTLPADQGQQRLWCCGVTIGAGTDIYLFDPHLGLPLPGPGGKGIATLASAGSDPTVLGQLEVSPTIKYEVAQTAVKTAVCVQVVPLSSLAPRLRHLQETILMPAAGLRLAYDPKSAAHLSNAAKAAGLSGCQPWLPGVGLLRRFLPKEEGGADKGVPFALNSLRGFTTADDTSRTLMTRKKLYELTLAPWELMPGQFRDARQFPYTVGLGERMRRGFAGAFLRAATDPQGPRELLLRGRYQQAIHKLVEEDGILREHMERLAALNDVDRRVNNWVVQAIPAYAEQLRAKNDPARLAIATKAIDELWKQAEPVLLLLLGSAAKPRDAEVTYQLGLCMQEEAEQLQARLDLLGASANDSARAEDRDRAKQAWSDALGWWDRFAGQYGQYPSASAARVNRGRCQMQLGDWQQAVMTWEDMSGVTDPMEQLASVLRVRALKKLHEGK